MGIDQAGDDGLALEVHDLGPFGDLDVGGRPDGGDLAVPDDEDAVVDGRPLGGEDAGAELGDDRPARRRVRGGRQREGEGRDQGEQRPGGAAHAGPHGVGVRASPQDRGPGRGMRDVLAESNRPFW